MKVFDFQHVDIISPIHIESRFHDIFHLEMRCRQRDSDHNKNRRSEPVLYLDKIYSTYLFCRKLRSEHSVLDEPSGLSLMSLHVPS